MPYIFLDESGDLGFHTNKKGTSKFFVVTLLFIPDNKRMIEKIVQKTHGELSRSLKRRVSVLHAANEKPLTRKRLLKRLTEKDCFIMTIYLDKRKVFTDMQDEKHVLYNYIANILLNRVYDGTVVSPSKSIELIASRRETNKFLNENFKNYFKQKIGAKQLGITKVSIKIPGEEKSLQAVDFVSWAIFRKYENNDDTYYKIVKNKIIEERPLFP